MQFELAPMEGVTTWVYRRAYHRHFTPADRYFTPFIAPNMNKGLNTCLLYTSDETGLVGQGTHERFLVENEKFQSKANAKKG